jgi:hypothetical protein
VPPALSGRAKIDVSILECSIYASSTWTLSMSRPRLHHILPAFYLSGFTDDGTPEGTLHVFDYLRDKQYSAKPRHVGHERDFYRVYEPNTDPYITEKSLAALEGELSLILKTVLTTGIFHGGEELGSVLSLVALNYVRARRARDQVSLGLSASIRKKLAAGEVTREQWDSLMAAEARAGVPPDQRPSFEEASRLVTQDHWAPKAPEVLKVGLISECQKVVFDELADRTWSLARTNDATGHFICSDTPLSWTDDLHHPGRLDTTVQTIIAPLNKYFALITRTDGRRATFKAEREVVAWVNFRTLFLSLGSIYWSGQDFPLMRRGGFSWWSDYISFVRKWRRMGIERP